MAEDRLILKEKIKLKKEIGLVGNQIDATKKSREDKLVENEQVEKDIKVVEGENIKLEEQIQDLEEQIAELDTEFKEAQLTAGRLRKMIKMSTAKSETEEGAIKKSTRELQGLNDNLDKVRRDIKREIDERKNIEYQLKTTKSRIDEMESKTLAKMLVTRRLRKDERYFPKGKTIAEAAAEQAAQMEKDREAAEAAANAANLKKADEAKKRAEAKAAAEAKTVEEASEEDLDLSL